MSNNDNIKTLRLVGDFEIKVLLDWKNTQLGGGKDKEIKSKRTDESYSVSDVFYQELDTLEDDPIEKTGTVSLEGDRDVGTPSHSRAVSHRIPSEERKKLSSNEGAVE